MPDYGRATVAEYNQWASGAFVTHLDVQIERVVGGVTQFQSYRNFGGRNWIRSARMSHSGVDVPIGSGTVILHRQRGDDNLSPLVTGSPLNQSGGVYSPAIEFGREILIRTACTPTLGTVTTTADRAVNATTLPVQALTRAVGVGSVLHFAQGQVRVSVTAAAGATSITVSPIPAAIPSGTKAKISHDPVAADWHTVFEGLTDDPEWGGKDRSTVEVPFRDRSGVLADTYVRDATTYGTEEGVPQLEVAQQIVDDWMGVGQYTLEAFPAETGFMVTNYEIAEVSVWEALEKLADLTGSVWRQVWSEAAGEFRLTLVTPPRDKTAHDYEVAPSTYLEVHHVSTGQANLRTIVRVYGVEDGTGEELVYQVPAESAVATDPKVLQYGPRYLQLPADAAAGLGTQAELEDFGDAIYADVSDPPIPLEVETLYCWFAQTDQLVRWKPNAILWDEDQDSAALSVSDDFPSPGVGRTRWKTAGKPKGHYAAWTRKGVAIAGRNAGPPEEVTATLSNFVPRELLLDGSILMGFVRDVGTAEVWGAARTFLGPETEAMWDEVSDATVLLSVDELTLPAAGDGYITLCQVEAISPSGVVGEVRRARLTGTAAIAYFRVEFTESLDGLTCVVSGVALDPRDVVAGMNYYLTPPGQAKTGPFAAPLAAPKTWEFEFDLPERPHGTFVELEFTRNDGLPSFWRSGLSDSNKEAAQPLVYERPRAAGSDQATLDVDNPDTDSASLWRREVIAGVAGAEIEIPPRGSDPHYGSFTITMSDTERRFQIYSKNHAGSAGPHRDARIGAYIAPGAYGGPALDVHASSTATHYTITWTGDSVTLSTGGAFSAPPASPIVVERPAAGGVPLEYTFRAERNGIPLTNLVTVMPIDLDTVTPDLSVVPVAASTNNTTQGFTATATRPPAGTALPVTVRLAGCAGTNNGVALPADTDQTVNGTIIVNRPAYGSGNGTATFTAQVTGGGKEVIQRTIPAIQQMGNAFREELSPPENGTTGYLTLTPVANAVFTKVETAVKSGNSAVTGWYEFPSAPYVTQVTLVEKHQSLILYRIWNGAAIIQEGAVPFDVGTIANVSIGSINTTGGIATVTVNVDTDTALGVGGVKYRIDGGTVQDATVDAGRWAVFDVAQTAEVQELEVWGVNASAEAGPIENAGIPVFDEPVGAIHSVYLFVSDVLSGGGITRDDVYEVGVTGVGFTGKTFEVEFYRNGILRSTQTFSGSDGGDITWTDAGVGNSAPDSHRVVVSLFDGSTAYGPPVPSRTVTSVVVS